MKVTLINTYESSGGAAVACRRLAVALRKHGTDTTLLVQEASQPGDFVVPVADNYWQRKAAFARFAADRLYFYFFEKSRNVRFAFSPGNVGIDISRHPAVAQADVLHLHWVNFGFLSLDSLRKLFALKKPIVWTLHDMWAFTGGCHYSGDCGHFLTHCHHCPFLKWPSAQDISYRVFEQKKILFQNAPVHFVTCSQWLADQVRASALLKDFPVRAIPNPIDTQVYQPLDKPAVRQKLNLPADKALLLFGAMNTQDPRKGFAYLAQALNYLAQNHTDFKDQTELVIFGKTDPAVLAQLPFQVHDLGSVKGDAILADIYNACDAMVLPSLEDNLPNTVMEALACGTPAVAFNIGGLSDLIDHKHDGYLAGYRSAEDLAHGIRYVLDRHHQLQTNARQSVLQRFAEATVAGQYQALYQALTANTA